MTRNHELPSLSQRQHSLALALVASPLSLPLVLLCFATLSTSCDRENESHSRGPYDYYYSTYPASEIEDAARETADRVRIDSGRVELGCTKIMSREPLDPRLRCSPGRLLRRRFDVEAFYIDKFEVSFARYFLCHRAGACDSLQWSVSDKGPRHPATHISLADARAFCKWDGGRLPTDAEWARAAHGVQEMSIHVGNSDCEAVVNIGCWQQGSVPVTGTKYDVVPSGVQQMIGNVREWVEPELGTVRDGVVEDRVLLRAIEDNEHIVMGHSFLTDIRGHSALMARRQAARDDIFPGLAVRRQLKRDDGGADVGFRCAYSTDRSNH